MTTGKLMRRQSVRLLLMLITGSQCLAATIYKYQDEHGNTVYSDTAPAQRGSPQPLSATDLPPLLISKPVTRSATRPPAQSQSSAASARQQTPESGYSAFGNSTRCREYQRKIGELRRDLQTGKYSRKHLLKQIDKFQQRQARHGCHR